MHVQQEGIPVGCVPPARRPYPVVSNGQGSHSDWKNGKAFSSQGILNRLEKSGKTTQNTGKLREFQNDIWMNCALFAKMDKIFS